MTAMPCAPLLRWFALLMCLWATMHAGAQVMDPTPRFALVFGNAAYTAPDRALKNPVSDARLMARTLRELNFDVRLREDMDRRSMLVALQDFEDSLRKTKGIGFLYFAGHGVQVNGRNYIVPIGANLVRDVDAQRNALDVDAILQSLRDTGARLNVMVLDACRNSPLLATNRSITGGKAQPGLAPMRPPEGALVAFATEPGRLASDGKDAGNGLYTRHLARWIKEPNITLEQVFKRTREAVQTESQGEQIPTEYSVLTGADLYLANAPAIALTSSVLPTLPSSSNTSKNGGVQASRSAEPEMPQAANPMLPTVRMPTNIETALNGQLSPRESLAKQGIFWDDTSFSRALLDSDYPTLDLFIKGGWNVRSRAPNGDGNALGLFAVLANVDDEATTTRVIKLLANKLDLTQPVAQFRGAPPMNMASNAIRGCNVRMLRALSQAGVNVRIVNRPNIQSLGSQPQPIDPISGIRNWGQWSAIDGRPCSKEDREEILKLVEKA
jgi:hypothetical protein